MTRTILVTFAGRRDRMELLARYAQEAIRCGLIQEWHVWDFARNDEDKAWLRSLCPATQVTPCQGVEYFKAPDAGDAPLDISFSVSAAHDAHIGLARRDGGGPSYEIVLGGWNNGASAIRRFDDPAALAHVAMRGEGPPPTRMRATPGLLPEFSALPVRVEAGAEGLKIYAQGALLLHDPEPVAPGRFDLLHRTGYGANGEWRWPGLEAQATRLFVAGLEPHFLPKAGMFYNAAYRYYAAHREDYANDVLLKCDDDIVYFDLDRLGAFIEFRRRNREYFLVSANVVNNGVCAHFQQQAGALPDWLKCELPPGGMCGSLWGSGAKAEAVHNLFLERPEAFKTAGAPWVWNERVSINFIALLGEDLVHIPDVTADDEHDLCYGVRKRAKKSNCIWPGFVAAHLSFWKQDEAMNLPRLLSKYRALADAELLSPAGDAPLAAVA